MNVELKFVNSLRVLSIDAIEKANSGHPGLPMGAAPMAYVLWQKFLKASPNHTKWVNRDRFILSAGHGSMLLYSLLHVYGYKVSLEDIKNFRQLGSKTPGHPEYGHTDGVDATTGPLGQGLSMAVGMAMAEKQMASTYNKPDANLIDHYTYALCGDGCLMEGITNEASSLAGTLGLNKLIVLYDSNNITIEGNTDIAFREDVSLRYKALGWNVLEVADGNDLEMIEQAIAQAKTSKSKPTLIKINTVIGYGSPNKCGKSSCHGSPLGAEEIILTKQFLNWTDSGDFFVPEEVYKTAETHVHDVDLEYDKWHEILESYKQKYPEDYEKFINAIHRKIPKDYINSGDFIGFDKDMATRAASGEALNRVAAKLPYMFGGSADLAPSNNSWLNEKSAFSKENPSGSNIHFGVREHAMAAISNGIALHGGLIPYAATFFVFSDYMKAAMRLSALMELPMCYILTHDSIGVGEDGPTHQPIEQLAMLRSIPNFICYRPADARETAVGWTVALESKHTPCALILSRQKLPNIEGTGFEAKKGAYILRKEKKDLEIIIIASGSEVSVALKAYEELSLKGVGVRLVSMPSMELFEAQPHEYREAVLPINVRKRIAVEAASSFGWHKYVGLDGAVISIDRFGSSGPGSELFEYFGINSESIVKRAEELL